MERHQTLGLETVFDATHPRPRVVKLKSGACYWDVTPDNRDSELALLAVHAHPDDEASKGAATLAKYADEGVRTSVVTCTGGERGDILNKRLDKQELAAHIAKIRAREMEESARVLNLARHYWLGFEDSGFPAGDAKLPDGCFANVPLEVPTRRLVEILRKERPQVVITYDELGGYPHPDHIRTHEVTMRALSAAADPKYEPDLGPPHTTTKVYYHASFGKERLEKLHLALVSLGVESPLDQILASRRGVPEKPITTKIPIVPWLPQRRKALLAHRSQVDPDSFFLKIPDELLAEVLPTDDYYLVTSTVETDIPEVDLFAGIR